MAESFLRINRSEIAPAVQELDTLLLDSDGRIKLLPFEFYETLDRRKIRIWATYHARYGIPTVELIQWLRVEIFDRAAIELGAGNGDLGHHLGILATDSYSQANPATKAKLLSMGQPPTAPREEVKRFDAESAIRRYQPKVAIASWLTQKLRHDDMDAGGTEGGADEDFIISRCAYIHIGHEEVHGTKRALKHKHRKLNPPWLVSRREDWGRNVIYVWG